MLLLPPTFPGRPRGLSFEPTARSAGCTAPPRATQRAITVVPCRGPAMLEAAQRLRYQVYCRELGQRSPFADHAREIIADDLDAFGHTFVAIAVGKTIGTLRANFSVEAPLGMLDELYGMARSPHHPGATAVCTKFMVEKSKRGSLASIQLISAVARLGVRKAIKECYIDSIPSLVSYYQALGFAICGPLFVHAENGASYPMMIDLEQHRDRLCDEGEIIRAVRERRTGRQESISSPRSDASEVASPARTASAPRQNPASRRPSARA